MRGGALLDQRRPHHHPHLLVPCLPSAALKVSGETRDYTLLADSGNVAHRRFCPVCGTHLFSASEARPHLVFVRAGTLE